ncbi:hypothetical protein JVU11DRAFT_8509 [Chiua virens]|nr:hypothetical protein JVU11DRAFT_8509 [Chiua virens]
MSANTSLGKRKTSNDEASADSGHGHGSTLFVSNLPYDATSTDLQTAFSDLAPVRSAFVVLEHGSGVSKGVGYVSFSMKEDAQTVFESITTNGMSINERNIRAQWAESKPKNKAKDQSKAANVKKEKETPLRSFQARKVNDPLAIRTIVVSGLPSSIDQKTLWKKLRKYEGAENVEWPAKTSVGEDQSTAHVLFSSSSLAQDAITKLHAHVFKGSLLSVTLKKRLENLFKPTIKKATETMPSRASRLIVRNLPFDINEQDLRAIFLPHGPIHSIHIPVAEVDDAKAEDEAETISSKVTRSKGFAFVWMMSKKDAESALEKCNSMKVFSGMANDLVADKQKRKKQRREDKRRQDIKSEPGEDGETVEEPDHVGNKGRVIAVDWALSKERWEKEKEKEKLDEVDDELENDVNMDDAASESTGEADSDHEQLGLHEEGTGDEAEESESDDVEDSESPEREDDESPRKPQLPHTDTGNTVFIRNVPFSATEDEIRTLFRAFGPLRYVRLALDPETERPRGLDSHASGTMKTRIKPSSRAKHYVQRPWEHRPSIAKNLVLHGRTLDVVRAVTREQATKLKEDHEKSREKTDKRNLYLLREGVILPNSPAAETIPQVELEKRTNSFNARRTMLRSNPSLYVSKTRLSIRQIPLFVTERVLKRLAVHSVREFNTEAKKGIREGLSPDELAEPAIVHDQDDQVVLKQEPDTVSKKRKVKPARHTGVKQAKIIRQSDRVDPVTGKGRSRGYGFIEMDTHADALRVLRWANNNPHVGILFDKWWKEELADLLKQEEARHSRDEARMKRVKDEMEAPSKPAKGTLIVEFSIENIQVVQRRAAQKEKVVSRFTLARPAPNKPEEPPSKKRRVSSQSTKPDKNVLKEELMKPRRMNGPLIGRKRRMRKAGKSARKTLTNVNIGGRKH